MTKSFYFLWLLKEIAKASWTVTKIIWSRDLRISPVVAWIPTKQRTDICRVIYANSITLTPGTITIDLEDKAVLVHALEKSGIEDLRTGEMDGRIC